LLKLSEINEKAIQLAANIQILKPLTWPVSAEREFLASVAKGQFTIPEIRYPRVDLSLEVSALKQLSASFTANDPGEVFTQATLKSYIEAAELVMAAGTPEVMELSISMFGKPGDKIPGLRQTSVDLAKRFVDIAAAFDQVNAREPLETIDATVIRDLLQADIIRRFGDEGPKVEISEQIAAKASASTRVVKLRPGTAFNRYDKDQLFVHEVMTHSLTNMNGSIQPILKTLGRGAPRTVATQEGLATFAEVITGSIDLNRLQRIALRILAIDRALQGADFFETYGFFLENGQSPKESFWSAARVFRGGFPDKNIVFTKDGVYLDGLIKVHTLFRWALVNRRLDLLQLLFCGRLSIEDLFLLEPVYKSGVIVAPKYLPDWYERIEGLAGLLTFSLVSEVVHEEELQDYFASGCRDV